MLVILWIDSWTRAWACSCSMNWEISCWAGVSWGLGRMGNTHLCRVVELVHDGLSGTLACEAGWVEERMMKPVDKSLRQNLVHRAHHSHLMDTVRASLVFLISLFSFSNPPPSPSLPWLPPPHGPQTSPSIPPTPTSGSQTSAPRTSPPSSLPRTTQSLIESFFPFAFQYHPVCRQEGPAHKTCRFRASLAKGYPI